MRPYILALCALFLTGQLFSQTAIENPRLQNIPESAGDPFGFPVFETDPSGVAGSALLNLPFGDVAGLLSITTYADTAASLTSISADEVTDDGLYQTRGRRSAGDGGANLYRYDAGSSAACDGGFILDGTGGDNSPGDTAASYAGTGTGRFIAVDQSVATAKQFGAAGDGVANDAFRIQALLSQASRADLPDGDYLINNALAVSDKTLVLTGNNAILRQGHATSSPTLTLTNCDDAVISGITFTGNDTAATYDSEYSTLGASSAAYQAYSGLFVSESDHVEINGCSAESRITGIALDQCDYAVVRGCRVSDGFGTGTSSATNFHPGVTLQACNNCRIVDFRAEDYGAGVLAGDGCANIISSLCTIIRPTDNGIYYSSASSSQVLNSIIDGEGLFLGSGVKIRGSKALVSGVQIKDVLVGIVLAGQVDESPAGSGFGGYGHRIENCVVESTNLYGLQFGTLGGGTLYLRDVVVSNCVFQNCDINGGTSAGVISGPVEYATFSNIHINGSGAYGIYMSGAGGSPNPKAVTFENIVIEDTVNMGFRLVGFQDGVVRNIKITNCAVTDAFRLFSCSRMFVYDVWSDAGRLFDDATSDNNRYYRIRTADTAAYSGTDVIRDGARIGAATYNPASLADGVSVTTTVSATTAALGDQVSVSFSLDLQGVTLTAWVSAADTVTVKFHNQTGGVIDLASGTIRVRVDKP